MFFFFQLPASGEFSTYIEDGFLYDGIFVFFAELCNKDIQEVSLFVIFQQVQLQTQDL